MGNIFTTGEPAPPSDLTLTAEEKEIVITFTLPVEGATGGSPIKSFTVCPVVGEIKGPFKTTFIKKEDHKQTSTFKYDGQQKEYAFSVSLTNAAGFISEELKEHICLGKYHDSYYKMYRYKAIGTTWGLGGGGVCIYKISKPFPICQCSIAKIQFCVSEYL